MSTLLQRFPPFEVGRWMEYPARLPFCFEDGVPPVMLILTPIALRRPTHELASPCELTVPCGAASPEATFRMAPTPSTTAVLATAAFHGPPPPSPSRVLGKRVTNSADMAHCLPFTTTLSGNRNAATMPYFHSARATRSTRSEVRVPSELGLCRSLGRRSRCRANPATRLPPRGLPVPWLSLKRYAPPPAGYARPHCHACKHL